jgi:hypothetical protein
LFPGVEEEEETTAVYSSSLATHACFVFVVGLD